MISKKHFFIFYLIFLFSCAEKKNQNSHEIPLTRVSVNKKPVASYIIPIGDPKLDRKFGAEIFETPETFKYFLVMYFDGTVQNDTLILPNLGIQPVVKIKPGDEKLSCIIGFADDKNVFREYKSLAVKNNQMRLSTLKKYYTESPQ